MDTNKHKKVTYKHAHNKKRINKTKSNVKTNATAKIKLNCSPKDKNELNNFSCYTNKSLIRLKNLWNARHPDMQIKSNEAIIIHSFISKHLNNVCNNELCWLSQKGDFGNIREQFKDSFAPVSPKEWIKSPNEWLSSIDIMKVMKQYENAYKCFEFIGPSPIDFDTKMLYGECVWDELCNFSLDKLLLKGKSKIGIIFNTDPHYKSGEHWISMFINIKKGKIFFFDSVGTSAPLEIKNLVNRIKEQGKKLSPPINFEYDENHPIEHQYGNTECGMYSIFFIVHMLEDKFTGQYLKTHILKDKYIQKFRKVYFNNNINI